MKQKNTNLFTLIALCFLLSSCERAPMITDGTVIAKAHREASCGLEPTVSISYDGKVRTVLAQQCHEEKFVIEFRKCVLDASDEAGQLGASKVDCYNRKTDVDQQQYEACGFEDHFIAGVGCEGVSQ